MTPESILASDFAAIVFDCDGTLMDTEHCWKKAREIVLQDHGVVPGEDFAERATGMHYTECGRFMAETAGRPELAAEITEQLVNAFRKLAEENPTTLPGAVEFVDRVSEFATLAVASNCPGDVVRTSLDAAGLLSYFVHIAVPDDGDRPKPYPDVYLTASRHCGAEPRECLAFEDSVCGIQSAARAGLRVVGIGEPPDGEDAALADLWVPGLYDHRLMEWAGRQALRRVRQRHSGQPVPRDPRPSPVPEET